MALLPATHVRLSGVRVLIAEANEDFRDLLRFAITEEGAIVDAPVPSGAASRLRDFRPEVVVFGLNLSEHDRDALFEQSRLTAAELGVRTRALVLTWPEDGPSALLAGFNAVACAPMELDVILRLLAQLADESRASRKA